MKYLYFKIWLSLLFACCLLQLHAQPGTTIELKKPHPFENRTLASEKSDTKKFGPIRHGLQNLYTHYNYYFNANAKLNDIVERAKATNRDDYNHLLPYYNYTLNATTQIGGSDIDSIIYKCTAGILLHDLRNDWVDNLYLALGKAYYYRQNFDSAAAVFQYINYAFAKKDDGYDVPIGSNESNTNGVFSVSTVEHRNFIKKLTSRPPSRNDALLWQARTLIATNDLTTSGGLLEIVRYDPNFPQRLQTDLHELLGYLFYKRNVYDSAAWHLSKAINNAENRLEKARWYFLTAQLYELANDSSLALEYYNKASKQTPDPVMEVYASLNSINLAQGNKEDIIYQKLNNLIKLGKREKYAAFRDIIYYAAAKLELERNNIDGAEKLLKKSITNNHDNPIQRSEAFLVLADLSYDHKDFEAAHHYYDSIQIDAFEQGPVTERILLRQAALKTIAANYTIIDNEDSLQHVAQLPEKERTALLKKTLKQIRRQQGLKDEKEEGPVNNPAIIQQQTPDLFSSTTDDNKANWYFNNNDLKATGLRQFKQKWGSRPNVDNWRRQADIEKTLANEATPPGTEGGDTQGQNTDSSATAVNSIEDLEANLPLTEDKLAKSNESIEKSLFENGQTFQQQLENYPAAIDAYNEMNNRFPKNKHTEESLLNLYYCYTKINDKQRADSCLAALQKDYPKGIWATKLKTEKTTAVTSNKNEASKEYEKVYDLFIEGKFEEAKTEKAKADSVYGKSYWSPQLLYIESIYYVSNKQDSTAITSLTNLVNLYPQSPLAEKAKTMIDVVKRRKEIENYLTNLNITRAEDEQTTMVNLEPVQKPRVVTPELKRDTLVTKPTAPQRNVIKTDTIVTAPVVAKTFSFNSSAQQFVAVLLDKVAPVYANEAKNAFNRYNAQTFYSQKINITTVKLDDRYNLVLLGPFADAVPALDYIDKTKPFTSSRILPWLTPDKYTYTIISQENLDLLKDNKDIEGYRKLIEKALPGKFK